jgi:hypothetical protein
MHGILMLNLKLYTLIGPNTRRAGKMTKARKIAERKMILVETYSL